MPLAQEQPTEKASTARASIGEEHGSPSPTTEGGSSSENRKVDQDLENQLPKDTLVDPYMLGLAIKATNELQELKKKGKNGKRLKQYYEKQNTLINDLLKPMEKHTEDAKVAEEATRLPVKIAVYASLFVNISLCVLQIYAAVTASSIALLASAIESIFDVTSNVVLYYTHKKATRLNVDKWPVGGSRLLTIGNIAFGTLLGSANVVVVVEALRNIVSHNGDETNSFHLPSILSVAAALAGKLCLLVYCFPLRKSSSQVRILWEDHRNDACISGFALLMSSGGSKLRWWLDPTGGLIISSAVILSWTKTIFHEFTLLAGKSASHQFIQLITYKIVTFSNDIVQIDTVRAYHSGPSYFVEVNVVMPPDTPLWKAHDVSQLLQDKLRDLPGVERAFVHVDYEARHEPAGLMPTAASWRHH